jgi:AraC-like DNA-binding protein
MSDSTFSRYFKAASGQTFTDMVMQLPLTRACRLLRRTTDSVADIATSVGYQNLSNFNRQFLRAYGMTPRQYRKVGTAADQPVVGAFEELVQVA